MDSGRPARHLISLGILTLVYGRRIDRVLSRSVTLRGHGLMIMIYRMHQPDFFIGICHDYNKKKIIYGEFIQKYEAIYRHDKKKAKVNLRKGKRNQAIDYCIARITQDRNTGNP